VSFTVHLRPDTSSDAQIVNDVVLSAKEALAELTAQTDNIYEMACEVARIAYNYHEIAGVDEDVCMSTWKLLDQALTKTDNCRSELANAIAHFSMCSMGSMCESGSIAALRQRCEEQAAEIKKKDARIAYLEAKCHKPDLVDILSASEDEREDDHDDAHPGPSSKRQQESEPKDAPRAKRPSF
jgi:hypothetical protein